MKVAQLCPTLCDLMDYRVHGFLQARILEWVAFPFFKGSSQPRIKPRFPALQADSLPAEPPGKPNQANGTLVSAQRYVPSLHTFSSETQNKHWPPPRLDYVASEYLGDEVYKLLKPLSAVSPSGSEARDGTGLPLRSEKEATKH